MGRLADRRCRWLADAFSPVPLLPPDLGSVAGVAPEAFESVETNAPGTGDQPGVTVLGTRRSRQERGRCIRPPVLEPVLDRGWARLAALDGPLPRPSGRHGRRAGAPLPAGAILRRRKNVANASDPCPGSSSRGSTSSVRRRATRRLAGSEPEARGKRRAGRTGEPRGNEDGTLSA